MRKGAKPHFLELARTEVTDDEVRSHVSWRCVAYVFALPYGRPYATGFASVDDILWCCDPGLKIMFALLQGRMLANMAITKNDIFVVDVFHNGPTRGGRSRRASFSYSQFPRKRCYLKL